MLSTKHKKAVDHLRYAYREMRLGRIHDAWFHWQVAMYATLPNTFPPTVLKNAVLFTRRQIEIASPRVRSAGMVPLRVLHKRGLLGSTATKMYLAACAKRRALVESDS